MVGISKAIWPVKMLALGGVVVFLFINVDLSNASCRTAAALSAV